MELFYLFDGIYFVGEEIRVGFVEMLVEKRFEVCGLYFGIRCNFIC